MTSLARFAIVENVKDSLQNVAPQRRVITDLDALRALANPQRAAILKLLMSGRSRTATECAATVGASPSACSYHLRELERFGFVVRDDPDPSERKAGADVDGRTRQWRASAIGFSLRAEPLSQADPESLAVFGAVWNADRAENDRLATEFADRFGELPPEWQDVADFRTYELDVTAEEVARLVEQIDALLLPYRAGSRDQASPTTRPVHIVFQAIPRIEAP